MGGSPCLVVLGDSMSLDLYPDLDARRRWGWGRGLGAGSLLFRNNDAIWPQFARRDLSTRLGPLSLVNLASDGATLDAVAREQLPRLERSRAAAAIVTLTVGGNDLLLLLGQASRRALGAEVERIAGGYEALARRMRAAAPAARLVLTTVYDPTDGTGFMPDGGPGGRLPIELLERFNDRVRAVSRTLPDTELADAHLHFLGHGARAAPRHRWFLGLSPIEPNVLGASELRRLWLQALLGAEAGVSATAEAEASRGPVLSPPLAASST